MTFVHLGLSEPLLRAVGDAGYRTPTPIQAAAIPHLTAGSDLLGSAQTGTGKTAAFALPIIHRLTAGGNPPPGSGRRIRVLVLAPTRELAIQIGESFESYGRHTTLRHVVVFGGVSQNPQTKALKNGVDVVVATPGRLVDLMSQGYVKLDAVQIFVLDEADRMLDMGFLPDVRRITAKLPSQRQTALFSATMPKPIEQLAQAILRNPVSVQIEPVRATTELIEQSVCFVSKQHKPQLLASILSSRPVGRAIVFTRTRHGADRVAKQLNRAGIRAEAIHGDKSQGNRQRTLTNFKSNRPPVLVATDVAARGIDIDGVSHVFNYDLPNEAETYVHRIGRTGRAGATGVAISFCDDTEREYLQDIQRLIRRPLNVERDLPELPARAGQNPAARNDSSPRPSRENQGQRTSRSKSRGTATSGPSVPAGRGESRGRKGGKRRPQNGAGTASHATSRSDNRGKPASSGTPIPLVAVDRTSSPQHAPPAGALAVSPQGANPSQSPGKTTPRRPPRKRRRKPSAVQK